MQHGGFEIAFRLAPQKIADAPLQMRAVAGNAEREFAWREQSRLFGFHHTVPRRPGQCTISCGMPRNGMIAPGSNAMLVGSRRSRAPIHAPWRSAKACASLSEPRVGIVSTISPLPFLTRSV